MRDKYQQSAATGTKSNLFVEMGLAWRIFSPNVHEFPFLFHFHSEANLVLQLHIILFDDLKDIYLSAFNKLHGVFVSQIEILISIF